MFSFLTNKLYKVYDLVRGVSSLQEEHLVIFFEEIKKNLIEADVPLSVINTIIEDIKKRVTGVKTQRNIKPGEYLAREFYNIILHLLQSNKEKGKKDILKNLIIESKKAKKPFLIFMVGLQGAGKTTTIGKILNTILEIGKKLGITADDLGVVSLDYDRPAAHEQLKIVADKLHVQSIALENVNNAVTAAHALKKKMIEEKKHQKIIIVDTAGRLAIDQKMMQELKEVYTILNPHESFLVLDIMMSQEGIEIAKTFFNTIKCSGIIITKVDSDAPGGIILGIVSFLSLPIVYITTGEKFYDIKIFDPESTTKRLLGMGELAELAKSAEKKIVENEKKVQESIKKGDVNFDDFINIMKMINSMGPMKHIISMLPRDMLGGVEVSTKQINDLSELNKKIFIMSTSMTKKERINPTLLSENNTRIIRVANGSGLHCDDIKQCLKFFFTLKDALKTYKRFFA